MTRAIADEIGRIAPAADTLAEARQELAVRGMAATDENVFLVAAAAVPGKSMDLNEGIRLLNELFARRGCEDESAVETEPQPEARTASAT